MHVYIPNTFAHMSCFDYKIPIIPGSAVCRSISHVVINSVEKMSANELEQRTARGCCVDDTQLIKPTMELE